MAETPGYATEAALEGGDAGDADQPEDDHPGRRRSPLARRRPAGGAALGGGGVGRLGQLRQAVVVVEVAAERGGLGLGGGEVGIG